jgi:4-hydroxybenzoyl-CoA thioesterase
MFEHRVEATWGECDIAGLVYFPRLIEWCHRALEALFGGIEGGYARFTGARRLGIPTVHLSGDFTAPVRYGERCVVRVAVRRIGRSSVTFSHEITRGSDGAVCARFEHVVSVCSLDGPTPVAVPDDVRALLTPFIERAAVS